MLQLSRKTFTFDNRNTQFIETALKIICCHTATLGLKGLNSSNKWIISTKSHLRINWRLILGNVIRCSALGIRLGYFIHMYCFNGCSLIQSKFFNSSIKEINRLLSKGMSNILKVTIEKKWHTQNFDFKSLKGFSPAQFLGSPNSHIYHWILKLLVAS